MLKKNKLNSCVAVLLYGLFAVHTASSAPSKNTNVSCDINSCPTLVDLMFGKFTSSLTTPIEQTNLGSGVILYDTKSLTSNTVTFDTPGAGKKIDYVFGAYAESSVADISNNTVKIEGGTITNNVVGGFRVSDGNVIKNIVYVNGGKVLRNIRGGEGAKGNAENNKVFITDGSVGGHIHAGEVNDGIAKHNEINISGGFVRGYISSGYSWSGNVTNNTVNILGGTTNSNVYGGYSNTGKVTRNTVSIKGGKFSTDPINGTVINGGFSSDSSDVTNNTLNIHSKKVEVKTIKNFANLNFYLPTGTKNDDTLLMLHDDTDISGVKIGIKIDDGAIHQALQLGEELILVKTVNGKILTTDSVNVILDTSNMQGGSDISYDFVIEKKGDNTLVMKSKHSAVQPPSSTNAVPSSSWLGMLALMSVMLLSASRWKKQLM